MKENSIQQFSHRDNSQKEKLVLRVARISACSWDDRQRHAAGKFAESAGWEVKLGQDLTR